MVFNCLKINVSIFIATILSLLRVLKIIFFHLTFLQNDPQGNKNFVNKSDHLFFLFNITVEWLWYFLENNSSESPSTKDPVGFSLASMFPTLCHPLEALTFCLFPSQAFRSVYSLSLDNLDQIFLWWALCPAGQRFSVSPPVGFPWVHTAVPFIVPVSNRKKGFLLVYLLIIHLPFCGRCTCWGQESPPQWSLVCH